MLSYIFKIDVDRVDWAVEGVGLEEVGIAGV